MLAFCVLPFFIFRWDATPILNGWNTQFTVSGGMALTTLYELIAGTYVLPGEWWLLGVLWLPAILIGAYFLRRGNHGFIDLAQEQPGIDFDLLPHPHLAFRTKPGPDPTHRADPGVPGGAAQADVLCRLDLAIDIHHIQYLTRSAVISHPARPDGKVAAVVRDRPHTPLVGAHAGGHPLADGGLVDGGHALIEKDPLHRYEN